MVGHSQPVDRALAALPLANNLQPRYGQRPKVFKPRLPLSLFSSSSSSSSLSLFLSLFLVPSSPLPRQFSSSLRARRRRRRRSCCSTPFLCFRPASIKPAQLCAASLPLNPA
ncbi:hypothetical protein VTO42DRAFT_5393 [Malbranchea cinnamomea]